MKIRKTLFLLFLIFCTAGTALPLHALPPERIRDFAGRVTDKMFPDADTVVVYDSSRCTYDRNGLGTEIYEEHRKIITERGRRELSSITLGFNATYEQISIVSFEIVRPDGKRMPVDTAANSRISIDHSSMGANIYDPQQKILSLAVPELAIGDTVHWKIKRTAIKSRTPGKWSNIFLLQTTSPILAGEVLIDAPAELPLASHHIKSPVSGSVIFNRKEQKGRITYHWQYKNIPQLIPEPGMPSLLSSAQRLLVSTAKDWQEISKWYYGLCRPRLDAVNDAMRREVKQLTAGKKSDHDRMMAIFQFVSQKIRYLGITAESNAPGYEPHDVSATFDRRHGVCRDKAALLAAMLELAGFKAYPVLFYSGSRRLDPEVPQPFFNHAVTAVEQSDGKRILMDPTFENTADFFPAWLAEQSYLIAKPDGAALALSPPVDAAKNQLTIQTEAALADNGLLTAESTLSFAGVNDQMYRSSFLRWTGRQRREFIERQLRRAIPGAELDSLIVTPANLRDTALPLTVKVVYRSRAYMPIRSGIEPLPLPILGRHFGTLNYLLSDTGLQKRQHPLRFETTAAIKEDFRLQLPDSLRITGMPPHKKAGCPAFSRESSCRVDSSNKVTGSRHLALKRTWIDADEYRQLRDTLRQAAASDTILPLTTLDYDHCSAKQLAAAFPDSDTVTVSEERRIKMLSESSWTTELRKRIKILTYAGVKDMAELKYAFDPACEKVEIEAAVTLPDGTVMRPEPREINLMDAGWVADAPRYPATRIMVVALPKVVPGAEITYTLRTEVKNRPGFSYDHPIGGNAPVYNAQLTIEVPEKLDMRISDAPVGVQYSRSRVQDYIRHRWTINDIPPVPEESMQPDRKYFLPGISVHHPEGWKKRINQWNAALETAAAQSSPELSATAAGLGLSAGEKATEATVLKIRDWCARHIREAGPPADMLSPENLSGVSATIKAGYGHTADRAALCGALLRLAGIKYEFIAVKDIAYTADSSKAARRHPDTGFAYISVFLPDHGIYLNDTDQYAELGTAAGEGKLAVALKSGRIISVRPQNRKETKASVFYRISLRADGSALADITFVDSGDRHRQSRKRAMEMTPEQKRQYFEKLAHSVSPAAILLKDYSIDAKQYPSRTFLRVRIPGFAALTGKYMQFELPGFRRFASMTGTTGGERLTPMWFNDRKVLHIRYEIDFPADFIPVKRRPASREIGELGGMHFREYTNISGNRCTIDCRMTVPTGMVKVEDYPELLRLQQKLEAVSAGKIILKSVSANKKTPTGNNI